MQRLLSRVGLLGVGLATVGATINSTLYNGNMLQCCYGQVYMYNCAVDGGERAVLFDRFRGVLSTVSGEGTHFLIPWVQLPIIYSIRSTPRSIPVTTGSKGKYTNGCYTIIYGTMLMCYPLVLTYGNNIMVYVQSSVGVCMYQ